MPTTKDPRADTGASASGTVSRALQLLTVLADAPGPVSVKQVADQMQLAPSTVHRLLQLLRQDGFVQAGPETRQYAIGAEFFRVSARVMAQMTPAQVAQPFLEALASRFDEAVIFGLYLPEQAAMTFVARADGRQRLKYHIDLYQPASLIWGASGKAILSRLPAETVAAIWSAEGPSPASGKAKPSLKALNADLEAVRAAGYLVTDGEKLPEAQGIAAPVMSARGVVGCLCLTSPKSRALAADIDEIGREVSRNAAALSHALGAVAA